MSEIRIEGNPAGVVGDHLYVVFVDNGGNEFVIRGGPNPDDDEVLIFGAIGVEQGIPIGRSKDERPVSEREARGSRVLELGDRDAEDVWNVMLQHAKEIHDARIDYILLSQNSNSTVASVLHVVGIDVDTSLPNQPDYTIDWYPGTNNILDSFGFDLLGTDGDDIIVGGSQGDKFTGGGGKDHLIGGGGDDTLRGDAGADILVGGADDDTFEGGAAGR